MELLKPFLELVDHYGIWAVTLALVAVVFLMYSKVWTKARDTQTNAEAARVTVQDNSNHAQKIINDRVTLLEQTKDMQAARIDALEADLAAAKESLRKARGRIARMTRQLEALEQEKGALATERDQLRTDLDTASGRIRELETQVVRLKYELRAEQMVREQVQPLYDLLHRALPPHTGDTDKLDPSRVPDTDPADTAQTAVDAMSAAIDQSKAAPPLNNQQE